MNRNVAGYLLTLLSATFFALSSGIAKWAYLRGFTPWSFSMGASLLAAVLLLPWLNGQAWRSLRDVPRWALILHPLLGAGTGLAFNLCLAYLDISLATLLLFLYPAVVVLGAWLIFGQRPTGLQRLAVGLTVVGAGLTAGPVHGQAHLIGIGLALFSLLAHSAYMLLGERLLVTANPRATTLLTRVATVLLVLLVQPRVFGSMGHLEWGNLAFLLMGALLASLLPIWSLLEGIARIGASRAAIISTAELPIALFVGWSMMDDHLDLGQGIGAVLIGVAILLIQRSERSQ